jgi:hypothetical protein
MGPQRRDTAIAVAVILLFQQDNIRRQPRLVSTMPAALTLRRTVLTENLAKPAANLLTDFTTTEGIHNSGSTQLLGSSCPALGPPPTSSAGRFRTSGHAFAAPDRLSGRHISCRTDTASVPRCQLGSSLRPLSIPARPTHPLTQLRDHWFQCRPLTSHTNLKFSNPAGPFVRTGPICQARIPRRWCTRSVRQFPALLLPWVPPGRAFTHYEWQTA